MVFKSVQSCDGVRKEGEKKEFAVILETQRVLSLRISYSLRKKKEELKIRANDRIGERIYHEAGPSISPNFEEIARLPRFLQLRFRKTNVTI